jgi:hypothetical protein
MPRVYVTSRNRTLSSASPSDFHFSLKSPMELPEGSKGYIDSFTCSNTWESVIAGINDKIYLQWSGSVQRQVTLLPGDVADTADLATKLTTEINAFSQKHVTVTKVGDTRLEFACPTLSTGETFKIWSRRSLLTNQAPWYTPAAGWNDACGIIGAMTKDLICRNAADAANLAVPASATTQFINLAPYQTLYLHSHIGTPDSYGPNGESTVIASVVCGDTSVGDLITHHVNGLVASPIELPNLLADMHFSLRDYNGKIIDTDGHDIAFTLVVE